MPNIDLTCVQCKSAFTFSERDQNFNYERNMPPPQRCVKCRASKKKTRLARDVSAPVNDGQKFQIVCDRCGKSDFVKFAPQTGREVLCAHCHGASRARSSK